MRNLKRFFSIFLCLCWFGLLRYLSEVSSVSTDVIGSYVLANEVQCNRLCWYRRLCSAYSYRVNQTAPVPPEFPDTVTCVLHTDSVSANGNSSLQNSGGWLRKAVSSSIISNGCQTRPCGLTQICVPTSGSGKTSPPLASSVCLPFAAQCKEPNVSNSLVRGSGRRQDDVVSVECERGFMLSPDNVSVEITCLVTSKWTAFTGQCMQYEFTSFSPHGRFLHNLLRELTTGAKMCVRGVMTGAGQFYISFRKTLDVASDTLSIAFRYQFNGQTRIIWNLKINDVWQNVRKLAENPLLPGDQFNLTVSVQSQHVQLVLNGDHVYEIPISSLSAGGIEISTLRGFVINQNNNEAMALTYVNLISGC